MLTLITAICGTVFGFAGLLLSILNYFRDRPELVVTLKWDMAVTDNPTYDPKKRWGIVRVTNVGRRPIHLAAVALKLPKSFDTASGFEHTVSNTPPRSSVTANSSTFGTKNSVCAILQTTTQLST